MDSAIKILPHYTYEDYCNWEGRWELIDGIPYAMSPAPILKHQLICASLIIELGMALKKTKCKHCRVYDYIDIKVSETTIVQPDITIICNAVEKNFLDFPAALVVEILSPSTVLKDRNVKFSLYEKMGIKYFLIIDIDRKTIEINILVNDQYQLTTYAGNGVYQFLLDDDCAIDVELANIWE